MTIKKETIFYIILHLIILILIFIVVFNALKDNGEKTAKFCNEKYGENNWYFKDITGTKEARESVGRFYIGQVWSCRGYGGTN